MKKRIMRTIVAMVLVLVSVSITSSANGTGWVEKSYGNFILQCNLSCTSSNGTAKTNGSMTDNKNRASVTIYNSNGVSVGNNTVIAEVPWIASASATKIGKVYKAASCHSLVRVLDGTHVLPLYQQVKMSITK